MKTKRSSLVVAAIAAGVWAAVLPDPVFAQSSENATTDSMLLEYGIGSYSGYKSNFASLGTIGFLPEVDLTDTTGPSWYDYWKSQLAGSEDQMISLRYYIRRNPVQVTDANYTTFDNVQRVMRIMPKAKFEVMFPNSVSTNTTMVTDLSGNAFMTGNVTDPVSSSVYWHTPGTKAGSESNAYFSYENFLKAVAMMPAFCGNYTTYPDASVRADLEARADLIARKFLASLFAHAVQETSSSGTEQDHSMVAKLPGTFASIVEVNGPLYPGKDGLFRLDTGGNLGQPGPLSLLTFLSGNATHGGLPVSHSYCGRGIKQTSYPNNYAAASLFLFGDLRLLAYPELIEEPGVMGYLSGLVYAMLPKDSNPSIFEVLDGSFHRKLSALASDSAIASNPAYQSFVATYDREFPLTVLLVNGGPECNGNPANISNTKVRIAAYNYFVTTEDLLNHVQVGNSTATTPDFTPLDPDATNGDQYVPGNGNTTVSNSFYNLSGNQDSCQSLLINTVNVINSPNAWQSLFVRPYYFGLNWDGSMLAVSASSGSNVAGSLQIFGGEGTILVMVKTFQLVDTDHDGLTDYQEVTVLHSNPFDASTFDDGLTDGQKHALGLSPGVNHTAAISGLHAMGRQQVTDNAAAYGLYDETSIQDLNLGGLMIKPNGNGTATLDLQLQTTSDLSQGFTDEGEPIELQVDLPGNKHFLRVRALGRQ